MKTEKKVLPLNGGPKIKAWMKVSAYARLKGLTRSGVYWLIENKRIASKTTQYGLILVRDK